jgi:hypothetical protein
MKYAQNHIRGKRWKNKRHKIPPKLMPTASEMFIKFQLYPRKLEEID